MALKASTCKMLFICLFAYLFSPSLAQVATPIPLRYTNDIPVTQNSPSYFEITAPDKWSSPSYLSIAALGETKCSPSLFVSKSVQFPNSKETSDYNYVSESTDAILVIPTDGFQPGQKIYVGVSTNTDCIVDFTAEEALSYGFMGDLGQYYSVYELQQADLQERSSIVLKIQIPETNDADRILIHINALATNTLYKPYLDVFIKQGEEAPDSRSHDNIKPIVWFEGITALIHKDNPAFCVNCVYTVSLKFEEQAIIQIHVGVIHPQLELKSFPIMDGIEKGKQNTYIATFDENMRQQNLRVDINPISGKLAAYIDCDALPDDLTKFKWNFKVESFEQILLTANEHSNCVSTTYYIAIVGGEEDTIYSIAAEQKLSTQMFMQKDVENTGDILPGEPIIFEAFLPIYAGEKVIFNLESQGNIDVSIKNCRFALDCPDLLPSSKSIWDTINQVTELLFPSEFKYDVTKTEKGKQIIINPHENGCVPFMMRNDYYRTVPLPVCAYKITLTSQENTTLEYKFVADIEGHSLIFPGMPLEDDILVNDQEYYVLYAPYEDIKSVTFQLTTLSGDVDMFVSNVTRYPKQEDDLTKFSHENFIIFTNSTNLNGTYYITIKGHQTSSFIMTATIITQDGRQEDYAIRLHEGIPQKGVILPKHEHPMLFYSMNLFFDNEWQGILRINVNPNRGNLVITVNNNNQVPLVGAALWQTSNHELAISSNDSLFNPRAVYYIGIHLDTDDSSTLSYDDISFTIVYTTQSIGKNEDINNELPYLVPVNLKHIVLSSDSTFEGKISKGEIRFFKFSAYSSDSSVTISLQGSTDIVSIFVSLQNSNQYPSPDDHMFTTKDTYKDYITITHEDLEKNCVIFPGEVTECPVYLSVITTKGDEIPFILDLRRNIKKEDMTRTSITQLSLGKERLFSIPSDDQAIYFYFYTLPQSESLIGVTARHHDIEIYAAPSESPPLGVDVKDFFTNLETMDYSLSSGQNIATTTSYNNLQIPSFNFTHPVLIICKLKFTSHKFEAFDAITTTPTFSIIVSNEVVHIFPGKPYNGEAYDDDIYQYYDFYVFEPDTSFKVTLTSLTDANQDLYLSFGQAKRPTEKNHDFYSDSSPRVEELSLSLLDVYPKTSMNGTWVIGVYSETKGSYSLLVTIGNQIIRLSESTPIQQYLPEKNAVYFSYYNDRQKDLYIKVDKMSGNPVVYIKSLRVGTDINSNLPSKEDYTWTFTPTHQSTTIISTADPHYCTRCLYVVKVETEKPSKFSFVVLEKGHWEFAQNGVTYQDSLVAKDTKGYFFLTSGSTGANVNVKAFNGELNIYTSHNPRANTTNYIQKVGLTPNDRFKVLNITSNDLESHPDQLKIWDGSKLIFSDPDEYYIILENPDDHPVNYTILFQTQGPSQIVILPNIRQHLTLGPQDDQSFIFYSSSEGDVIKLSVEYSIPKDKASTDTGDLEFSASYWSEKSTTGSGDTVVAIKDDTSLDKILDGVKYMRKSIEIKSKVGKYQFNLENLSDQKLPFSFLVYSNEGADFISLEENSYHFSRIKLSQSETFEVYLTAKGSWYFELNQCSGKFRIAIADSVSGLSSPDNVFTADNDAFFYKSYIENPSLKYIRITAYQVDLDEDGAAFLLKNMYFKGTSPVNFNAAQPGQIRASEKHYRLHDETFPISFEPISFPEASGQDFALYKVVACQDKGLAHSIALCEMHPLDEATGENCQFDEITQSLDQMKAPESELNLKPGDYYLYVVGNIMHNGEAVHSVPYAPVLVSLHGKNKVLIVVQEYWLYIAGGLGLGLVVFIFYLIYRKIRRRIQAKKSAEIENARKRGYGIMQEEF